MKGVELVTLHVYLLVTRKGKNNMSIHGHMDNIIAKVNLNLSLKLKALNMSFVKIKLAHI